MTQTSSETPIARTGRPSRRFARAAIPAALALGCVVAAPNAALASQPGVGLGLVVGDPTGLSFKYFRNEWQAFDVIAGLEFIDGNHTFIEARWLAHSSLGSGADLDLYWGFGPALALWDRRGRDHDDEIGIAGVVPVGLDYAFRNAPVDIFIEIVPGFLLIPDVDFLLGGGLGARYWF